MRGPPCKFLHEKPGNLTLQSSSAFSLLKGLATYYDRGVVTMDSVGCILLLQELHVFSHSFTKYVRTFAIGESAYIPWRQLAPKLIRDLLSLQDASQSLTYVVHLAPNLFERWIAIAIAVPCTPMGRTSSKDVRAVQKNALDPIQKSDQRSW